MYQQWLDTNSVYLTKLKVTFEIIRWEEVTFIKQSDPSADYSELLNSITRDYEEDGTFRSLVDVRNADYIDKKIAKYIGAERSVEPEKLEECVNYIQIKKHGFDHFNFQFQFSLFNCPSKSAKTTKSLLISPLSDSLTSQLRSNLA